MKTMKTRQTLLIWTMAVGLFSVLEEKLADYSCDLPREVHPFYDALLEEESSYSSTIEESVHLNVYPNPTDGYVRVTFDPSVIDKYPSERAEIIITDSYGVPSIYL